MTKSGGNLLRKVSAFFGLLFTITKLSRKELFTSRFALVVFLLNINFH